MSEDSTRASSKWWRKLLKLVAKIAFSALFLYLVFRKIDFREIWTYFQTTNLLWILPAAILFIASKVVSSFRLNRYFRSVGLHFSESDNLRLYWLGMYYNMFLPGGIGGDGYKVYLLNRRFGVPAKSLFWAVFLDRVSGVAALGLLSALLFLFLFPQPLMIAGVLGLVLLGALLYVWMYRKWFANFWDDFWITNLQGLLVQGLQLACAWCIMRALDIEGDTTEYLLLFLVSSVVAIFPFTIGGLGARELTFVYGSEWLKLNPQGSVVISFWFYLITLVVSLAGILYVFREPLRDQPLVSK